MREILVMKEIKGLNCLSFLLAKNTKYECCHVELISWYKCKN